MASKLNAIDKMQSCMDNMRKDGFRKCDNLDIVFLAKKFGFEVRIGPSYVVDMKCVLGSYLHEESITLLTSLFHKKDNKFKIHPKWLKYLDKLSSEQSVHLMLLSMYRMGGITSVKEYLLYELERC